MGKYYWVTGGYLVEPYRTADYSDALDEYLRRIKLTKPFTDCVIEFYSREFELGRDLKPIRKTIHKVKLIKQQEE